MMHIFALFSASSLPFSLLSLLLSVQIHHASAATTTLRSPPLLASFLHRRDSAQQASVEYTDDDDFRDAVLNSTNAYRAQHNASALSWNQSLAEYAAKWSSGCVFKHSGGPSGENLAAGYPNTTAAHEAWGDERNNYDFSKAQFSEATGHFTQLVWKSTTTVGCGRKECDCDGKKCQAYGWYVVCEYYPPGNVIGAFKENVQARVQGGAVPSTSTTAGVTATGTGGATASSTAHSCPYPGQKCSGAVGDVRLVEGVVWLLWVPVVWLASCAW